MYYPKLVKYVVQCSPLLIELLGNERWIEYFIIISYLKPLYLTAYFRNVCSIAGIVLATIGTTTIVTMTYLPSYTIEKSSKAAPSIIATSDENVYVVWDSNNSTENNTVIMFRTTQRASKLRLLLNAAGITI